MSEAIESQPAAAVAATLRPARYPAEAWLPTKGDHVQRLRNGVTFRGRIFYADHLQVLVKWDDGSSSSLRVDKAEIQALRLSEARSRHSGPAQ